MPRAPRFVPLPTLGDPSMPDDNTAPASSLAASQERAAPVTNPGAPIVQVGAQSGVEAAAGTGPVGRTIKGRYRIKRLLGEGGMGGVYEGEHLEIGKRVAIKLVHALHARDP